ncbi:MAG: FG-GAP-like repeat-containing protein [Thermoanaerobaculia bacterium]
MAVVCLAAAPAFAQWSTQSPLPTFLEIRGVAVPQAGHLLLATDDDSFDDGGALFESTDGGSSWIQRNVPESLGSAFHGIRFRDELFGWAWGNENYRTTDGGATWEALPLLGSTYRMDFPTSSFGIASGNFDLYVTRDGGLSWEPSPEGIYAFGFADETTGLGAAATGLYRTTDGGTTFLPVVAGVAAAVECLSAAVAVAIVDDELVRSTDGGVTFATRAAAEGRSELAVLSPDLVLAWGRSGTFPDFDERIFRSSDGGDTWADLGEPIALGPFSDALRLAVPALPVVVAADGAGGLHRSTDAGLTWSQVFVSPGPVPGFLSSSAPIFVDSLTGYYGLGSGYLVRTTDGGASWEQISSGSEIGILGLGRFANGDLLAVGESGQVLTSVGGAAPWRIRASLGSADLVAVQILPDQTAIAVAADGRLHASSDGGATWSASATVPPAVNAEDLFFESASAGWVVGQGFSGAALFRTTDAGASWTGVPDFQGTYVAVDFAGDSGWATAVYGTIYRTLDHGSNWEELQLPGSGLAIGDAAFWNADVGYAVGGSGYAVRTSDGGLTWQPLPIPDGTANLEEIALLGADELWVAVSDGKALYSNTAGQNWAVMDSGAPEFGSFRTIVANPAGDAWIGGWRGAIRRFAGPPPPPVNQPPMASYEFVATGLSVAFTDTSSDADGTIVAWEWDFGDGETSTEQNPTHLFPVADTYHVLLTVTDDDGDTDSALRFLAVQSGPGGVFGDFTEVTPLDPLFVTPQDEDFWVAAAAPADYDSDGDLDIVVLGYYVVYNVSVEEMLVLLRNDGAVSGTEWEFAYVPVPLGTLSAGASDLAWGDADGDGDQDLLVASDGQTILYRNNAGTLVPTDTVLPAYWEDNDQADFDLQSVTWADFDNDGDLDLLLPSVWDDQLFEFRTALLRNDGANGTGGWTFSEVTADLPPTYHAQSSWADFDGDQDLDLLLVHLAPLTDEGFIRRYRNDGDGVFVGEEILGTLSVEHGEVQWGDYDGDGDLDILVAGNVRELDGTYDTVLRVYRNDAETFVPEEIIPCPACEGWFDLTAATWADYDSDGDIDILLAGTYNSGSQIEGRAKIYDNVGGLFVDSGNQLPAPRANGFSGGSFSWLDVDGEGDLDYFIAGSYFVPGGNGLIETQMHLYLNDAEGENAAPTAPLNPDSSVSPAGEVTLTWDPATDDLTPAQSLTYQLELRRSGPSSSPRHTPEPGSLSAVGQWTLRGLADGYYTWRLKAVDSAFNSGPAAAGGFFVGDPLLFIFADGFESGGLSDWSEVSP